MNTSETIGELATALAKAQGQMGSAEKNKINKNFGNPYADLTSVIDVIKKPLAANGLAYVQVPIVEQGRTGVITRLMHTSGEFLESCVTVQLAKDTAQGVGSALTYSRRYSLQSMFGIPADDDDGESAEGRSKTKGKSETLCGAHQSSLRKLIRQLGVPETKVCHAYNVSSLDQIPTSLFEEVRAKLKEKIANKETKNEK